MNVLVTGANGQLGSWIRNLAAGSRDRYIFTDVAELDITSAVAVREMLGRESVDVVVNCAAFTDVEGAEDKLEMAERLNGEAPGILAAALRERNGLLVHISTDYVFGGDTCGIPCREDAAPAPLGVYGVTKLHGEQAVMASGCHHIIIRTAWLYSEYGKNFLLTMLRLTAEKQQLKVVGDQLGTPTYARDLAAAIIDILDGRKFELHSGIYHFSNEGECSWFDFAVEIAGLAGHRNCKILPCRSEEYPSKVRRPSYSVLDKSLIKSHFGVSVPYWKDSLAECIANIQKR